MEKQPLSWLLALIFLTYLSFAPPAQGQVGHGPVTSPTQAGEMATADSTGKKELLSHLGLGLGYVKKGRFFKIDYQSELVPHFFLSTGLEIATRKTKKDALYRLVASAYGLDGSRTESIGSFKLLVGTQWGLAKNKVVSIAGGLSFGRCKVLKYGYATSTSPFKTYRYESYLVSGLAAQGEFRWLLSDDLSFGFAVTINRNEELPYFGIGAGLSFRWVK